MLKINPVCKNIFINKNQNIKRQNLTLDNNIQKDIFVKTTKVNNISFKGNIIQEKVKSIHEKTGQIKENADFIIQKSKTILKKDKEYIRNGIYATSINKSDLAILKAQKEFPLAMKTIIDCKCAFRKFQEDNISSYFNNENNLVKFFTPNGNRRLIIMDEESKDGKILKRAIFNKLENKITQISFLNSNNKKDIINNIESATNFTLCKNVIDETSERKIEEQYEFQNRILTNWISNIISKQSGEYTFDEEFIFSKEGVLNLYNIGCEKSNDKTKTYTYDERFIYNDNEELETYLCNYCEDFNEKISYKERFIFNDNNLMSYVKNYTKIEDENSIFDERYEFFPNSSTIFSYIKNGKINLNDTLFDCDEKFNFSFDGNITNCTFNYREDKNLRLSEEMFSFENREFSTYSKDLKEEIVNGEKKQIEGIVFDAKIFKY